MFLKGDAIFFPSSVAYFMKCAKLLPTLACHIYIYNYTEEIVKMGNLGLCS